MNLHCLQELSGWEVKKVDGANVKMIFKNEIVVSFNANQLSRGNSATVGIPSQMDPVQQFMYSSLTPSILKGDIRTVLPSPINPESNKLDPQHNNTNPPLDIPPPYRTRLNKFKAPNISLHDRRLPENKHDPPALFSTYQIPRHILDSRPIFPGPTYHSHRRS